VIGIFDCTKWHKTALLSFVSADRVNAIVTDSSAPTDEVAAWHAHGVEVITVDALAKAGTPVRSHALRPIDRVEQEAG
jgi:hypothetical protein